MHRRNNQAGLTITEMMISVLLAGMLSGGLFYMTSGQQRTYNSQMEAMVTQEGLWGAAAYLKRQIRLAGNGFGRCPNGDITRAPNQPVIHALRVFNGCNLLDKSMTGPWISETDTCSGANGRTSSDTLMISYLDDRAGTPEANPPVKLIQAPAAGPTLASFTVSNGRSLQVNDWLMVQDLATTSRECALRVLTSVTNPNGPGTTLSTKFYSGGAAASGNYSAGLVVDLRRDPSSWTSTPPTTLIPRYFAIDRTTAGFPRLITWQPPRASWNTTNPRNGVISNGNYEVVAEGIEDMQISWACDVNDDQTLSEGSGATARQSDEWAYNVASDTLPNCAANTKMPNIQLLRITLIARAKAADPQFNLGFRPAAEDRQAGTIADDKSTSGNSGTYPRKTITFTVRPENLAAGS